MVDRKVTFLLFRSLLSMQALSQSSHVYIESRATRIYVLGENYSTPAQTAQEQSRIIVYSMEDSSLSGATSLFVNGGYHASLISGAYTEFCYVPGTVNFSARQVKVGQSAVNTLDSTAFVDLRGGETHFLRVGEQAGRAELYPVSAVQAQQELTTKRLQIHTISRVAQRCAAGDETPVSSTVKIPNQQKIF